MAFPSANFFIFWWDHTISGILPPFRRNCSLHSTFTYVCSPSPPYISIFILPHASPPVPTGKPLFSGKDTPVMDAIKSKKNQLARCFFVPLPNVSFGIFLSPLPGGFFCHEKTHYPTFGTFRLFKEVGQKMQIGCYLKLNKVETVKKTTM